MQRFHLTSFQRLFCIRTVNTETLIVTLDEPRMFARRALLLAPLGTLAACAAKPVVLDRTAMSGIKRVGVPTIGFPKGPDVDVVDAAGRHFGAIGLISTGIVFSNREDALASLMKDHDFDPAAFFRYSLMAGLKANGFDTVPMAASATRSDFLSNYGGLDGVDAVLDVCVRKYGLLAADDSDASPYRPTATLAARLIEARNRSVLMQDNLALGIIDAPVTGQDDAAAAPVAFATFSEVTANPDRAINALRGGLRYASDSVLKRLT